MQALRTEAACDRRNVGRYQVKRFSQAQMLLKVSHYVHITEHKKNPQISPNFPLIWPTSTNKLTHKTRAYHFSPSTLYVLSYLCNLTQSYRNIIPTV